jgi:hypothetical protein
VGRLEKKYFLQACPNHTLCFTSMALSAPDYEALRASIQRDAQDLRNRLEASGSSSDSPLQTMASPDSLTALGQSSDDDARSLSIEELCFSSAMSCFEGWLKLDPAIGPKTMAYVTKFITRTLEKTHNLKDIR